MCWDRLLPGTPGCISAVVAPMRDAAHTGRLGDNNDHGLTNCGAAPHDSIEGNSTLPSGSVAACPRQEICAPATGGGQAWDSEVQPPRTAACDTVCAEDGCCATPRQQLRTQRARCLCGGERQVKLHIGPRGVGDGAPERAGGIQTQRDVALTTKTPTRRQLRKHPPCRRVGWRT